MSQGEKNEFRTIKIKVSIIFLFNCKTDTGQTVEKAYKILASFTYLAFFSVFHVQILLERNIPRVCVPFCSSLYICKCPPNDCQTVRSNERYSRGVFLEIHASRSPEPKRVSPQPCRRAAKTRRPRRVVNWQDGLEPRAASRTVAWIEREWLTRARDSVTLFLRWY